MLSARIVLSSTLPCLWTIGCTFRLFLSTPHRMVGHDSLVYTALMSCVFTVYIKGSNTDVSELICPKVADLNSSVLLSCISLDSVDIFYIQPGGTGTAAICISRICHSIQTNLYNGTIVNMTHSYLEIKHAQLLDGGNWICRNVNNSNNTSSCNLILRKMPSCSIRSYNNTDNLMIGVKVTLSIHIKDYYCSRPSDFLLQTGYVQEYLMKEETTDAITSNMYNSTFTVSKSHIGSLEILHTCNNISQSINCDGIQRLLDKPPACNITSEDDTQALYVDKNITLMVHVEIYNCSESTKYELQTGQTMEELVRREANMNKNMDALSSTFAVRESHFGYLSLLLYCNNVSRSVTCDGVQGLNKKQLDTLQEDGVPYEKPQYNIVLIAGIAAGAVIALIVIVIVVYVVKKRSKSQKTSEANEDKDNEMAENVNGRSENITLSAFGAYEDIGDVNSTFGNQRAVKESTECNDNMESFQNQGYMSGEELRLERTESWNPHKSGDQPEARPENIYTQVNKKPKPNT